MDNRSSLHERLRQQKARQKAQDEQFYQNLITGKRWLYVKIGAILSIIVASAFLLDIVIPTHKIPDQVEHVTNSIGEGRLKPGYQEIYTRDGEYLPLTLVSYSWGEAQQFIRVEKTWFNHFPVGVTQERNANRQVYPVDRDFWQKPPVPIIFLGLPALLLFYRKRTVAFTALYMMSFYVLIPLTAIFLLGHFRWLHMLTLGFI